MFTLETPPAGLPFTTRSSLQALLKSRRAISVSKRNDWLVSRDEAASRTTPSKSKEESSETLPHQNSASISPSQEADLWNGDHNGDFSYSQKLFHIDDGNLYSIFSPLQGRSYGMKPSFLRKQKCTIQECHGRGRKILRKGLKFHNFLPSESVTSEKDNSFREDQWKVHSECKLREEHGTKQIMVSNWSQSIKHTRESSSTNPESHSPDLVTLSDSVVDNQETSTKSTREATNICNVPLGLQYKFSNVPNTECIGEEKGLEIDRSLNSGNKFSFLNNLLQSVSNSQSASPIHSIPEHNVKSNISSNGQKRRRKPNQTRKVVPYTKYLSLIEETESSPLDLSLHTTDVTKDVQVHNQNCSSDQSTQSCSSALELTVRTTDCDSKGNNVTFEKPQTLDSQIAISHVDHSIQSFFPNVPSYLYSLAQQQPKILPEHSVTSSEVTQSNQNIFQYKPSEIKKTVHSKVINEISHQSLAHRSSNSSPKAKTRRKSQRSVIKQKLEDTFRQNGFLVKTKQVSDGDATFCKFRQLRKYTRYYLKSWQQHLPDEVHKMWKGFLPPKTVLPPVSGSVRNLNEDPT